MARARGRIADFWDELTNAWLAGEDPLPDPLPRWYASYDGRGDGQVTREARPQDGQLLHAAPAVRLASPRADCDAHRCSCRLIRGEPGRLVGSCLIDPSEQIMVLPNIVGCRARHERGWRAEIAHASAAAQACLLAHLSLSGTREHDSAEPTMHRLVE